MRGFGNKQAENGRIITPIVLLASMFEASLRRRVGWLFSMLSDGWRVEGNPKGLGELYFL